MSRVFIDIIGRRSVVDAEGFSHMEDSIIASVRASKEDRHGSKAWANRAVFSSATAMFRFRALPGISVRPDMAIVCAEGRYRILSVEDVGGRGMYIEALTEITKPSMA
jgi:predicted transcriptional regulator